jgi:hypothetical protein
MAAHLCGTTTSASLKKLVTENTRHSGGSVGSKLAGIRFKIRWNNETASSRGAKLKATPLPLEITDANMRTWMNIQFYPKKGKDVACFDLWLAVMTENRQRTKTAAGVP